MDIQVIPAGFVKRYVPEPLSPSSAEWGGKAVAALILSLGIPSTISLSVLVNGEKQGNDYALREGDSVKLIPLMTGG